MKITFIWAFCGMKSKNMLAVPKISVATFVVLKCLCFLKYFHCPGIFIFLNIFCLVPELYRKCKQHSKINGEKNFIIYFYFCLLRGPTTVLIFSSSLFQCSICLFPDSPLNIISLHSAYLLMKAV